jgi:hypothetical protein
MENPGYQVINTGIIPKFLANGETSLSEINKKTKGTSIVAGGLVLSVVGVTG